MDSLGYRTRIRVPNYWVLWTLKESGLQALGLQGPGFGSLGSSTGQVEDLGFRVGADLGSFVVLIPRIVKLFNIEP